MPKRSHSRIGRPTRTRSRTCPATTREPTTSRRRELVRPPLGGRTSRPGRHRGPGRHRKDRRCRCMRPQFPGGGRGIAGGGDQLCVPGHAVAQLPPQGVNRVVQDLPTLRRCRAPRPHNIAELASALAEAPFDVIGRPQDARTQLGKTCVVGHTNQADQPSQASGVLVQRGDLPPRRAADRGSGRRSGGQLGERSRPGTQIRGGPRYLDHTPQERSDQEDHRDKYAELNTLVHQADDLNGRQRGRHHGTG